MSNALSKLNPELWNKIQEDSVEKTIPKNTEILREGQYIKVIPLVLSGLIKVYTRYEDRELLLYYIQPEESCIMSFSASLSNDPSQVYAVTEEDTVAMLIPVQKVAKWMDQYPSINNLFFNQYKQRYSELLNTIQHILFNRLDKRLYEHLRVKAELKHQNPIKISHQQLANELGTVREVVSRVVKKLESEGLLRQTGNHIEVLGGD